MLIKHWSLIMSYIGPLLIQSHIHNWYKPFKDRICLSVCKDLLVFAKSKLKPWMKDKYLHFTYNAMARYLCKECKTGAIMGKPIHVYLSLFQTPFYLTNSMHASVCYGEIYSQSAGFGAECSAKRVLAICLHLTLYVLLPQISKKREH